MEGLYLFFYTIMLNGKFLNLNFMKGNTEFIDEAIKFDCLEAVEEYREHHLRKDLDFEIVKVNCSLERL